MCKCWSTHKRLRSALHPSGMCSVEGGMAQAPVAGVVAPQHVAVWIVMKTLMWRFVHWWALLLWLSFGG